MKSEIFSKEQVKDFKKEVKQLIRKWHKVNPDYIFATETSAIPPSYLIKEAWKKAYPNEKPPTFYRIDPKQVGSGGAEDKKYLKENKDSPLAKGMKEDMKKSEDYFKKRIRKDNANIIVYDECGPTTRKKREAKVEIKFDKKPLDKDFDSEVTRVRSCEGVADRIISSYLIGQISKKPGKIYVSGGLINVHPEEGADAKINFSPTIKFLHSNAGRRLSPVEEDYIEKHGYGEAYDFNLTARIIKHHEQRGRAIKYVSELKQIGKEAGEELAKKRKLEAKITSTLAIGGLIGGLFFLSPTFTGNAIVNLNIEKTNWIGGVLFVIGLIGALFVFRRKK